MSGGFINNKRYKKIMSEKRDDKPNVYTFLTDNISYEEIEFKGRKRYYITGFISTQDIDVDNDLVTKKGMKSLMTQLNERQITTDWDHDVFLTDNNNLLPTGKIVESKLKSKEGKDGAWVKVELNPSWKRFDKDGKVAMQFTELWTSIKDGFTNAFSIAFKPLKVAYKAIDNMEVRLLDEVKLLNVAITGMPVNPGAMMESSSMKSIMLKALKEYKEETKMADEPKPEETPKEETKAEEKPVEEVKEEPKAEVKSEEVKKESKEDAEVKSLKEEFTKEMKSMRERLEAQEKELKSLKDKSVFKSKTPEEPEKKSNNEEVVSVMGVIR